MSTKPIVDYSVFESLDIRVGKILKVEDSKSAKLTYRLTIDFGADIGIKVSCGAYRNYPESALIGRQVIGIVNFAPKKMGPEISEVLVLGVENEHGDIVYLTVESEVPNGVHIW